jgi:hypothetical protein
MPDIPHIADSFGGYTSGALVVGDWLGIYTMNIQNGDYDILWLYLRKQPALVGSLQSKRNGAQEKQMWLYFDRAIMNNALACNEVARLVDVESHDIDLSDPLQLGIVGKNGVSTVRAPIGVSLHGDTSPYVTSVYFADTRLPMPKTVSGASPGCAYRLDQLAQTNLSVPNIYTGA